MYRWKIGLICGAMLIAFAFTVAAAVTKEDEKALGEAFQRMSAGEDAAAASVVLGYLANPSISDNDWLQFFERRFQSSWFTPALARFWEVALGQGNLAQDRVAFLSACCAASAAGLALRENRADSAEIVSTAMLWLERMRLGLGAQAREMVLRTLENTLAGAQPAAAIRPGTAPAVLRNLFQLHLWLGGYAADSAGSRQTLSRVLGIPEPYRRFWETHGIFLFDAFGLSPAQVDLLSGLLMAIPSRLHRIVAVVCSDSTGIDPRAPSLDTAGQLVFVPALPLTQMTHPREFGRPEGGAPVAPEFAVVAAQQIFRAIQAEQFARRPELVFKRDLVLAHAREARARYLRRTIPPKLYQEQPDELLPAVAYLWFLDTPEAFRMAFDVFRLEVGEPMDSLLLMADVLSNGEGNTYFFHMTPQGQISSNSVPIGRIVIRPMRAPRADTYQMGTSRFPAQMAFVNTITVKGTTYRFSLNEQGAMVGWTRLR